MIWILSKLGLASNLRRVPQEKILLAEMREAKRLIEKKREKVGLNEEVAEPCAQRQSIEEVLEGFTATVSDLYATVDKAIADKAQLSKSKLTEIEGDIHQVVRKITQYKPVLAKAK
jgi:stearoyl-CoA desaturase (delta-9 desaturase)